MGEIHGRQDLTKWLSVAIALLGLSATGFSIVNHVSPEAVQKSQEALVERQREIAEGMNVMHETLTPLDTRDPAVLQANIGTYLQLLSNIVGSQDSPVADQSMRSFCTQPGAFLSQQLSDISCPGNS